MRPERISAGACLAGAMMLLILPFRWLLAALLAAGFHELCHYAALRCCRVKIYGFRIGSAGAVLDAAPLSAGRELICLLAGPLGGLLLLFFIRWIPRIAICACCHSLYNLLPMEPLDGGRALRCGVRLALAPERAEAICSMTQKVCLMSICILSLYACFVWGLGLLPVLAAGFLVIRQRDGKIPCKLCRLGVQ